MLTALLHWLFTELSVYERKQNSLWLNPFLHGITGITSTGLATAQSPAYHLPHRRPGAAWSMPSAVSAEPHPGYFKQRTARSFAKNIDPAYCSFNAANLLHTAKNISKTTPPPFSQLLKSWIFGIFSHNSFLCWKKSFLSNKKSTKNLLGCWSHWSRWSSFRWRRSSRSFSL